jgi:Chitobiase/beta-hexosaminidase C-terminal domain
MTKRLWPLLLSLMMVGGWSTAHAANCPIAAGASASSIQSTLNSCSSGNTATFAAGTYYITSAINIPCGVSLSGPVPSNLYPGPYTATFSSSLGSNWMFSFPSGCTAPMNVNYLNFNGNRPQPDGGGAIYLPQGGGSNVSIEYNYFYGNQANASSGNSQDTFIWIDGQEPTFNIWTNVNISWNQFGSNGDCSNVMSSFNYDGGYANNGGQCAAIGIHANTTNLTIKNNSVYYQEEGFKCYEGSTTASQPSQYYYMQNNFVTDYNDLSNIHRIGMEYQCTPAISSSANIIIEYNDMHDAFDPGFGSWMFSLPMSGSTSSPQTTYSDYNVMLANPNIAPVGYLPGAFEFWGQGHSNNNLIQGELQCGTQYGFGSSPWAINNNVMQVYGTYSYGAATGICNEEGTSPPPTETGNSISATGSSTPNVSAQISTTPTISPASGSFSGSQTVTLTNPGTGINANTSIWYTTDGSTPVPGSGTAKFYTGPFAVTTTTIVKAVGMWGSLNQPTSYAPGYGYVPSSVVSATYTGGGTPIVATPVLSPASETFTATVSVSVSSATAGATLYCTTNGATPTTSSPVYTGPFSLTATTTVQCLGAESGYLNSAVGSGTYTLSSASPTITSGYLGNTGSINTLAVGASAIQFTAYANYNNGTTGTLPDTYGNTAVWSSSNTAILTVGSAGLVSCAALGTANAKVMTSPGGINFNPWTMTCTAPPPTPTLTSVSLAATGGVTTLAVSTTNQILATCTYSDGSTTSCNTTDAHGNAVSLWTTSAASIVSLSSSGLATGAGVGSANLNATVAGLTSPALALTVTSTHTLTGAYLATPGSANTMVVGGTLQFSARCTYSDGTTQDCTVTDLYGDAVSGWASNNTALMTIENVGAATPGLATAVGAGTAQAQATIDGSWLSNPWIVTISPVPVSLTGLTLATTGGVTGILLGQTNQLVATCLYSDGTTTTCNTTDSHGNVASSYASSATAHATVNATTGLVTGVGAGNTNLTAQAGSFTSPTLPVMVALVPSGTYTITISGNVRVTGQVSF